MAPSPAPTSSTRWPSWARHSSATHDEIVRQAVAGDVKVGVVVTLLIHEGGGFWMDIAGPGEGLSRLTAVRVASRVVR